MAELKPFQPTTPTRIPAVLPSVQPNTIEYDYDSTAVLEEPYAYLLSIPGKGIRVKLLQAFNQWFKVPNELVAEIGRVVQMLHTASLLIDDIEDNSKLRRGIPVAHLVYGVPNTINCANYIYFRAMEECTKLGNSKATQAFLEEMIRLHHGQGYDIFWRDSNTCPSEEDYMKMVTDKTGGLFRLGVKMLQAFSENDTYVVFSDFVPLVNLMGLFFQIRDDYMNLQSEENKSFAEDLSEGKFSFPIIHSVATNPTDRRLLTSICGAHSDADILRQRTEDIELKKVLFISGFQPRVFFAASNEYFSVVAHIPHTLQYAVAYMEKTGSLDYTRTRIFALRAELLKMLDDLGGNEFLTALIEKLSNIDAKPKKSKPQPALRLSTDDVPLSG